MLLQDFFLCLMEFEHYYDLSGDGRDFTHG